MPTYRITHRATGDRIGPASIIADNPQSAFYSTVTTGPDAHDPEFWERYDVTMTNQKPDPVVCTVVRADPGGGRPWEVMTTGDRGRALREVREMGERGQGNGVSVVEEGVEVNRVAAKGRRS